MSLCLGQIASSGGGGGGGPANVTPGSGSSGWTQDSIPYADALGVLQETTSVFAPAGTHFKLDEITAPTAVAGSALLHADDDGGGNTRFNVLFENAGAFSIADDNTFRWGEDTDGYAGYVGRARFGSAVAGSDFAVFGHVSHQTTSAVAVLQDQNGQTLVQSGAGQTLILRSNNGNFTGQLGPSLIDWDSRRHLFRGSSASGGASPSFEFRVAGGNSLSNADVPNALFDFDFGDTEYTGAGGGVTVPIDTAMHIDPKDYTVVGGNSITFTDAATVYIENGPITSDVNVTFTNAWALWVDDGHTRLDGDLDHRGTNLGFYGATPVAQAADPVALTDSTGGTADNTVAEVSGSGADATINDNFADLVAKYNSLRTILQNLGLTA